MTGKLAVERRITIPETSLKDVSMAELVAEVNRRRPNIVRECVDIINEQIMVLKSIGIKIHNENDDDYYIDELSVNGEKVTYEQFWD